MSSALLFLILNIGVSLSVPLRPDEYLYQYGYLGEDRLASDVKSAILRFQQVFGLRETGLVDQPTYELMASARCGLSDDSLNGNNDRSDDDVGGLDGSRLWTKTTLTWTYGGGRIGTVSESEVRDVVKHAFGFWAANTAFRFTEAAVGSTPDIRITFETYMHNDKHPFDGPGGELGHAFFPWTSSRGVVHMDGSEKWSLADMRQNLQYNLYSALAHEIGHTLGLRHHNNRESMMFPFYRFWSLNAKASAIDAELIRDAYGRDQSATTPPMPRLSFRNPQAVTPPQSLPLPPLPPNTLPSAYDAVTQIRGELFIFTRDKFWRYNKPSMRQLNQQHQQLRPLLDIHKLFRFPIGTRISRVAGMYDRFDNKISLIADNQYFLFSENRLEVNYPKHLSSFGIDEDVAHAIPADRGYTYFVGNRSAYMFNEYTQTLMGQIARTSNEYHEPSALRTDEGEDAYALSSSSSSSSSCNGNSNNSGLVLAFVIAAIALALTRD